MTEKEKKAIETLKDLNHAIKYSTNLMIPSDTKIFDVTLNLIEKQQKELNKEKEKNKEYENKIKAVLELIDTKPYTAYTLYGDILYDDENIRELLEERND